jgi:hypothetical protein
LYLADKILPGLTNAASHPRYFALICAGVHLSGDIVDTTRREIVRKRRQERILRLERFWALANVLARPDDSGAVRGVTYAEARAEKLQNSGAVRTSAQMEPRLGREMDDAESAHREMESASRSDRTRSVDFGL